MSTKKQVYVWDGTDCKLEWIRNDFPNLDVFKVETGMLIQSLVNLTYLNRNDFSMWVKLGQAIVSSENGTPILLSESDFEKYVMKEYGVYYVHDKALECIIKQQSGQDTKNNMMQPVQAPVIPKGEDNISIRRMPVYEWDGTPSKFLELKNAFPNIYINYYEGRATSSNKNLSLSESPSFHEVLKVGDKITSLFGKNPLKLTEDEVKYYVNKEDSSFYIYNNVLERIIQSRKEKSTIQEDEKGLTTQKGEDNMSNKRIPVYEWDGTHSSYVEFKKAYPSFIIKYYPNRLSKENQNLYLKEEPFFYELLKVGEKMTRFPGCIPIILTENEVKKYVHNEAGSFYIYNNDLLKVEKERKEELEILKDEEKIFKYETSPETQKVNVYEWDNLLNTFLILKEVFPRFIVELHDDKLLIKNNLNLKFLVKRHEKVVRSESGTPILLTEKEDNEFVYKEAGKMFIHSNHLEELILEREKESPIEVGVLSDETKKMAELLRKEFKEKDEINLPISKWIGENKKSMEFMFPDAQIDIFFETLIITIEDKQYKFPKNTIIYVDKDGNPKEMLEAELENVFMVQKDSFFYIVEDSVFV